LTVVSARAENYAALILDVRAEYGRELDVIHIH
jgi:hypothetical protein